MEPSSLEFSQWRQMEQLATSKREPNSSGGTPWTRGSDTSRSVETPRAAATAHPSHWSHPIRIPPPRNAPGLGGIPEKSSTPRGFRESPPLTQNLEADGVAVVGED